MIGIPLTMGFVSKYRFALAAFERPLLMIPTLIVLAVSTVLNGLYFIRVVVAIYLPPERRTDRVRITDHPAYAVCAIAFTAMNLAAGIAALPIVRLLESSLTLL